MINANLDTFIDYEWEHAVELFYKGYLYYCSGNFIGSIPIDKNKFYYTVTRWKAVTHDNIIYHEYRIGNKNGNVLGYEKLLDVEGAYDDVKKKFFSAPIFDGKSFWEVEKEIAWLEQGEPIIIDGGD
ncbi:MAG: hypothetical protein IJT09_06075 [Abditibacteriota bacterium]|nr:hypothetical protein [Abditibacteriota bacterium]